jgi:hypothetical protein
MNKPTKVLITIVLIIGFFIIGTLLQAGAGVSKTFIGLLALGLFYGIRTMWKKDEENKGGKGPNEITLNKD